MMNRRQFIARSAGAAAGAIAAVGMRAGLAERAEAAPQEPLQAPLWGAVCCPKCDAVMVKFSGVGGWPPVFVYCPNPACPLYGQVFRRPTVPLTPVEGVRAEVEQGHMRLVEE